MILPLVIGTAALASVLPGPLPAEPVRAAPSAPLAANGPRLRPLESRVALLLRLGVERSRVLRDLVAHIEGGRVFVYIGFDRQMADRVAGSLTLVGSAGPYRYLRIALNPALPADQAIAALAHELQHVVEVMDHPEVTSEAALEALYRRIGRENRLLGRVGWETEQATLVGSQVRRELTTRGAVPGPRDTRARR